MEDDGGLLVLLFSLFHTSAVVCSSPLLLLYIITFNYKTNQSKQTENKNKLISCLGLPKPIRALLDFFFYFCVVFFLLWFSCFVWFVLFLFLHFPYLPYFVGFQLFRLIVAQEGQ